MNEKNMKSSLRDIINRELRLLKVIYCKIRSTVQARGMTFSSVSGTF
ncbi:hypothetical protein C5S39_10005 [Candidatus Methanophagaceae archaeon]|nr:hypothetical protein C5S39_10005 [Methanophagales archaeon]